MPILTLVILLQDDLPTTGILLLLVLCIVAPAAFVSVYLSRKNSVKRKLQKIRNSTISNVLEEEVAQVTGKITLAGKTLVAPFSQNPCAYFYIVIQEYHNSGKNSYWSTILEEEQQGDIIITDGTGFAIIDTSNIKAQIGINKAYTSGFPKKLSPLLSEIFSRHGYTNTADIGLSNRIKCSEIALTEHDTITAAGHGSWVNAQKLQLRVTPQMILAIKPLDGEPVYLSDDQSTISEALKQ